MTSPHLRWLELLRGTVAPDLRWMADLLVEDERKRLERLARTEDNIMAAVTDRGDPGRRTTRKLPRFK